MPSILLIPDRFTDYRMWSDIPDRIQDRARVVHFDRHEQVPWPAADGRFLDTARRLAARDGTFDIVAAAGQAARLGFAVAEAGLARSVVFFYPSPDRLLGEAVSSMTEEDLAEMLSPYVPIVDAMQEEDAGLRRDILLRVVRDTAGTDVEPAELELALGMIGDHVEEFFAELRALPDPPWPERPWIDRVGELAVPITVVVTPGGVGQALGDAVTHGAVAAEIVVARPRITPVAETSVSAEALLRMLDRVTR